MRSPADLDARVLPRLAARAGAVRDRLSGTGTGGAPRRPRGLRSLDDRYASRGPLALLRDVPQLGLVLVAAVFLAGMVLAVSREGSRARVARTQQLLDAGTPGPQASVPVVLGPAVGTAVAGYVAQTTAGLAAAGPGQDPRLALVSLSAYLTPAQAVTLLGDEGVRRVYLRAPAAGNEAASLPVEVTDLAADLARTYRQTATGREAARLEYQRYVDTIVATTADEKAFQQLYAGLAKAAQLESAAYAAGCACVYAAVVDEPPAALQDLSRAPGVRAVEVAPPGAELATATVVPLPPEVTTTVPERRTSAG